MLSYFIAAYSDAARKTRRHEERTKKKFNDRIRRYREALEDAADFELLVNFHGCTVPRGWSREFPHLVAMEGVSGAEQYKFNETFPAKAPSHNTTLPFTRNVAGSNGLHAVHVQRRPPSASRCRPHIR